MDAQFIDRIYEASFVPDLWPRVLGDLCEIAGASAGYLFVSKGEIHHWATSATVGVEAPDPLVRSGWVARSERFLRFIATRHSGLLPDSEIYTADEMEADPFHRDIIYPRESGWAASTIVRLPTDDVFALSLERDYALGPVEPARMAALDEVRAHLARSALMSSRLQLERARAASDTLAAVGLAAAVLDETGRVLAANPLVEAMTGCVHWRAFGRLSFDDKAADKLLQAAIATIDSDAGASVRSFPAKGAGGQGMYVAHVIPIRLSARDIFTRCAAVLLLTPVILPQAPPVELVQSLFDLTAAEARVARSLARGKTVDDIASDGGVSPNTIRAQVRAVLEKTGCNRQVDVVALLTAISSVGPMLPL